MANSKKLPKTVTNSSQILTEIYTTKNYSLFGLILGNRELEKSNLNKIKQSLSKKYIKTNPVICLLDEDDKETPLKIVDGQHRFEVCKNLNIPVSYVIDYSLTLKSVLDDITLLNTANKEWDVSDFMNSEKQKGNTNYELYSDIYVKYMDKFDHESLFYILNENKNRNKNEKVSYPLFKNGDLKFDKSDYNYMLDRLKLISQFNEYNDIGGKRYFQKALNILFNENGFDPNKMMNKLKQRQSTITKSTTVDGALRQLVEIYNHKSQSNRILFIGTSNRIERVIIE